MYTVDDAKRLIQNNPQLKELEEKIDGALHFKIPSVYLSDSEVTISLSGNYPWGVIENTLQRYVDQGGWKSYNCVDNSPFGANTSSYRITLFF